MASVRSSNAGRALGRGRSHKSKTVWLGALVIAAYAVRARAEPADAATRPSFGEAGEWALLGSSNSLALSNQTFSNSDARFFDADIDVGIDRFIVRNFSLGIDAGAHYFDRRGYGATTFDEIKGTSFSGGVRFGYNLPIGELVSWYPRLTLGVSAAHSETTTLKVSNGSEFPPPSSESAIGPWLNLYAPLLIHLAPHFFVGLGPRWEQEFGVTRGGPRNGTKSTLLGAQLVVGGWWGGPAPAEAGRGTEQIEESLGTKGQVVITSAAEVWGSVVSLSHHKGSRTSFVIAPGVDYFIAQNLSVGVEALASHSTAKSLDSTSEATDTTSTSIGVAPRIGQHVRLTSAVSCWPQLELGFGTVESDQSSSSGRNQHSRTRSWLRLSLPLLVHAASHFFVGVRFYFFYELSDKDQRGYENAARSAGLSLLLGGWR